MDATRLRPYCFLIRSRHSTPPPRSLRWCVWFILQGFAFAKEWCSKGNGPIYIEVDTYR